MFEWASEYERFKMNKVNFDEAIDSTMTPEFQHDLSRDDLGDLVFSTISLTARDFRSIQRSIQRNFIDDFEFNDLYIAPPE